MLLSQNSVDPIGIEPMPAKDYIPRRASQLTPEAHKLGGNGWNRTNTILPYEGSVHTNYTTLPYRNTLTDRKGQSSPP